jgi:hypothetical protein
MLATASSESSGKEVAAEEDTDVDATASVAEDEEIAEPSRKKQRTLLEEADDLGEENDEPDQSIGDDSDAETSPLSDNSESSLQGRVGRKRKSARLSTSKSKNASSKFVSLHSGVEEARRHNLRKMAEAGMGGRVMFLFEKVSKSKLGEVEEEE